jgi:hypothetical protein
MNGDDLKRDTLRLLILGKDAEDRAHAIARRINRRVRRALRKVQRADLKTRPSH